jgi:hypothetical protein
MCRECVRADHDVLNVFCGEQRQHVAVVLIQQPLLR